MDTHKQCIRTYAEKRKLLDMIMKECWSTRVGWERKMRRVKGRVTMAEAAAAAAAEGQERDQQGE